MTTNTEINKKYNGHILTHYSPTKEIKLGMMLNEARSDTAQQIFAELDGKLVTRLHKVSDLKKDNPNTVWCIKEKDYNTIKKKHGVEVD